MVHSRTGTKQGGLAGLVTNETGLTVQRDWLVHSRTGTKPTQGGLGHEGPTLPESPKLGAGPKLRYRFARATQRLSSRGDSH